MYVARFDKKGIWWNVALLDKNWSEQMMTNVVEVINTKRFLFHGSAERWIRKEITKDLFTQHKLEIIDG